MGLSSPVSRPFGRARMWIPWSWRYWTVLIPSARFPASRSILGTTTTSPGQSISRSCVHAGRRMFLPFWTVSRPVPSGHSSTSPQVRSAASERLSPPSARTPMIARSRAARRWAVSADSIRPPRPRRGRRRASRTRARASAVRASACLGPGPGYASP